MRAREILLYKHSTRLYMTLYLIHNTDVPVRYTVLAMSPLHLAFRCRFPLISLLLSALPSHSHCTQITHTHNNHIHINISFDTILVHLYTTVAIKNV